MIQNWAKLEEKNKKCWNNLNYAVKIIQNFKNTRTKIW